MDSIIYNIPASYRERYRGRQVTLRSPDPLELVNLLPAEPDGDLAGIQLLSLGFEPELLKSRWYGVPLDVVMQHPARDYPLLYRYAPLLDQHPVRISLAVVPGFSKALKLAVSLNFAVKLEVSQPDPSLLEELTKALHFYLHHPTVTQPIEFFHSLLSAFYQENSLTLWTIQEEDPTYYRYLTDQGEETVSARLADLTREKDLLAFVQDLQAGLLAEPGECSKCEFWRNCAGYFKLPHKGYSCLGVKPLLQTLRDAAAELRHDLTTGSADGKSDRS
jgi:hypothetical protein